jgi:hypothetical protein
MTRLAACMGGLATVAMRDGDGRVMAVVATIAVCMAEALRNCWRAKASSGAKKDEC